MDKDNNDSFTQNSLSPQDSESEKSFVKKVKSRVSGLFPTSLSKWFGGNEKSNIRSRDELEEDDVSQVEPPSKRVKRPSNEEVTHDTPYTFTNHKESKSRGFMEPLPGPSGLRFKKTLSTPVTSNNIFAHTTGNEKESDDEESTSGYSSMARLCSKERLPENIKQLHTSTNMKAPSAANRTLNLKRDSNSSVGTPERSLFLDTSLNPQGNTSLSSRRPSFNATFGSPNFVDKTMSTKRIINSPFYKGRTIYGGAAAYAGRRLTDSMESKNLMKASIQMKPSNEPTSNGNTTLSKTARRILDTLEQYTTPISDAKKIPHPSLKTRHEGLISKYTGANPYMIRESKTASNRELNVPTVPDLLKMKLKEKIQDSTVNVRNIAATSKSVLNKGEYTIPSKEETSKHTSKIRTKLVSTRQKKADVDLEEQVDAVKLPDVHLPITTLPKFDFILPSSFPISKSSTTTTKENVNKEVFTKPVVSTIDVLNTPISDVFTKPIVHSTPLKTVESAPAASHKINSTSTLEYKFSNPLVIAENLKSIKAINNFIFSEPVSKKISKPTGESVSDFNFNPPPDTTITLKKNTLKVNGENTQLISTGSVMDVLGKKQNAVLEKTEPDGNKQNTGFGSEFKIGSDKWECNTCMVRNSCADNKCVACTTPRPPAKTSASNTSIFGSDDKCKTSSNTLKSGTSLANNDKPLESASSGTLKEPPINALVDKFRPAANSWTCSVCLIVNAADKTKCAACENPKPGAEKSKTDGFGNQFKLGSDKWECAVCMVRNNTDAKSCVACTTPRPTTTQSAPKPASVQAATSGFGNQFKPASNTWECSTCMIRNSNDVTKCVACETLKPGAPAPVAKSPIKSSTGFGEQFKKKSDEWECSSCMVKNANNKDKCICCDAPKPGTSLKSETPAVSAPISSTFTFGIGGKTSAQGFTFGIKPGESAASANVGSVKPSSIFGDGAKVVPPPAQAATFSFGVKSAQANVTTTAESKTTETKPIQFGTTTKPTVPNIDTKNVDSQDTKNINAKPSEQSEPKSAPLFSKPVNGGFKIDAPKADTATSSSAPPFSLSAKPVTSTITTVNPVAPNLGEPTKQPTTTNPAKPIFVAPTQGSTTSMFKFNPAEGSNQTSSALPAFNTLKPLTANTFGSTPSTFAGQSYTPASDTKTAEKALFEFGSSSAKDEPAPKMPKTFSFGQTPATGETKKPAFKFANYAPTAASAPPPAFNFSAGSNPQSSALFNFGSGGTTNSTLSSAANSSSFTSASQPAQNGGFNFGSSAAVNNTPKTGFNFGSSQFGSATTPGLFSFGPGSSNTQQSSAPATGGFNFGGAVPTPTFNFTGGSQAPAFSATTDKPTRVIKRAMRRTQR